MNLSSGSSEPELVTSDWVVMISVMSTSLVDELKKHDTSGDECEGECMSTICWVTGSGDGRRRDSLSSVMSDDVSSLYIPCSM